MYAAVQLVGGFPCVVKPLHQRASRGVSLVDTPETFLNALHCVAQYEEMCLIEERLQGTEHSAEILFDRDGAVCHFHLCDRFFDYASGVPLEIGHINPSCLTLTQQAAIKAMLLESAAAMGVRVGSWKCDVIFTNTGPKILEATARCSGGYDAQVSYPRASGDNLLRRVIQVACDAEPTPQPPTRPDHYCAVASITLRKAGRIEELPMLGGEVIWAVKPGESVQPPTHCAERAGFVVLEGSSYDVTWLHARMIAEMYEEALAGVTR
jgi:biotin carboxylase